MAPLRLLRQYRLQVDWAVVEWSFQIPNGRTYRPQDFEETAVQQRVS
jgi:hypothetical protein